MRATVIDYKAGNLTSVVKALRYLGAEVEITDRPEPLAKAERIILPGVGHFSATGRLDETGLTSAIRSAIARGIPFLGICVGMQWLLDGSSEAPQQPGLGHFIGRCERFSESITEPYSHLAAASIKIPHVGWNTILPRTDKPMRLLDGIRATEGGEFAYFTHSYLVPTTVFARPYTNTPEKPIAAITHYIRSFASAVEHENVFGVQFHPEKSGETGLKILRNFLEFQPC
jgi:imidazole glycerol-phosphate synthase subunit HisH